MIVEGIGNPPTLVGSGKLPREYGGVHFSGWTLGTFVYRADSPYCERSSSPPGLLILALRSFLVEKYHIPYLQQPLICHFIKHIIQVSHPPFSSRSFPVLELGLRGASQCFGQPFLYCGNFSYWLLLLLRRLRIYAFWSILIRLLILYVVVELVLSTQLLHLPKSRLATFKKRTNSLPVH